MTIVMLDPANLTPFYSYALCNALAEAGHRVDFYTTEYSAELSLKSPNTFHTHDFYFRSFRGVQRHGHRRLRQLVRIVSYPFDHLRFLDRMKQVRPSVVHIQWSRVPWLDLQLIKRLRREGIPVVHTVHDIGPLFFAGPRRSLEDVYRHVDAVVVHATALVGELLGRYRIDPGRVHVIPHGPLQSENIPSGANQQLARAALGIPADADVVLFFGEIKHYKGLDLLLEACCGIAEDAPGLHLLIAGKPVGSGTRPDLTTLKRCGVRHQADLQFVSTQDVWKYFLAADIVALPYREITQSGVLFTALAHGRYVLCAEVGGLPEIISATGGGQVFPPGRTDVLGELILQCFNNKGDILQKGQVAGNRVRELYNWRRIADMTVGLYGSLTSGKAQSKE